MIGSDKDSQKRMIGELLKAADRYIKAAEWNKALDEVGKALAIEPNNMYAKAYKDRIDVSLKNSKSEGEQTKKKEPSPEDKKTDDKAVVPPPEIPAEKKSETPADAKTAESPKIEKPASDIKSPAAQPTGKEESPSKVDSLRQEFAATQAKLQREVAQLTMQLKEAQVMKDSVEKNLSAQVASLQKELASAKQQTGKADSADHEQLKNEIETLKSKQEEKIHQAVESVKADMAVQFAALQKELVAAKSSAGEQSLLLQGERILKKMFAKAWHDGVITNDERALLLVIKGAIELTEEKFGEMEAGTKNEAYASALRSVWSDGVVTPEESDFLTSLREKLGVAADDHFRLESQVRKEVKK